MTYDEDYHRGIDSAPHFYLGGGSVGCEESNTGFTMDVRVSQMDMKNFLHSFWKHIIHIIKRTKNKRRVCILNYENKQTKIKGVL